jgi:drug/metabolite transporter (DMT)-like permease
VRERTGTRHIEWELALIGVTAVWGATFPIVKCAVSRCPDIRGGLGLATIERPTTPFMFLSLRFALAALAVGAFSIPALRSLTRRQTLIGIAIGLALCGGYVFQTFGLQRTTASNAGFITGLYVVLTPLLGAAVLRRFPSLATGTGAVVAAGGLLLLAAPTGISLGLGDGLVLVCALAFAVHILLLGRFAGSAPLSALVTIQLACTAAVSGILSLVTEREPIPAGPALWGAIALTALLASAAAAFLQTGAQRYIPPSRAAVILTMESPFAAVFGYLMLDERLAARGWIGAGLILVGMLVAELLAPAREDL